MFDIVDMYGNGYNEELLVWFLKQGCLDVVIVIKFGICKVVGEYVCSIDNSLDYIWQVCDVLLWCLGGEQIGLYYVYCVEIGWLIEDMMQVLVGLVQVGKIVWIGFSEVLVVILCWVYVVYFVVVV